MPNSQGSPRKMASSFFDLPAENPPDADPATSGVLEANQAVVIPVALVLQFISGVYLFFWLLPEWLQNVANLFPLAWMAKGMRAVFLPPEYATLEQSGAWELGGVAIALLIWLVVGLVISRLTFRWIRRDA